MTKSWLLALPLIVGCKKPPPATAHDAIVAPRDAAVVTDTAPVAAEPPAQYQMQKVQERPQPPRTDTGFARYDDAMEGKSPWLTDAEAKAGFAELVADPANKALFAKRACGAAAKKAAEAAGAVLVQRTKDKRYEPAECRENGGDENKMGCLAQAIGDDDLTYYLTYQKTGDAWMLTGMQATALGKGDAQHAAYDKALVAKCK